MSVLVIQTFNEGQDLKAVGYVRVSTEDQAREGFSLEAQERAIRAYCDLRGWRLMHIYRDEGLSAYKDVRRPQYEAMMAAMDSWDVVVVWKLNRLHRTMRGFIRDAVRLQESEKDLASVTEAIDTSTAMGKLVYHFLGALSEFESDQTSERVRSAFAEKFESDKAAWFTRPPLGYDMAGGRLVLNETEAEIVRFIFRRIREGASTKSVVVELTTMKALGKQKGKASQVQVLQIAHNPVYAGYVYYRGVLRKNGHEAIVSVDDFNDTQVALYARTKKHHRYPLLLGAERIEATSKVTSGRGQRVYIPKERPPGLDALVAKETLRRGRVS